MTITQLSSAVGTEVTIQGWLYNSRSSGSLAFLELRDGSGFVQAVVEKARVSEGDWTVATTLTQESSLRVTGVVSAHPKKPGVYEIQASGLEVIHLSPEFPISLKDHGPEFLF